MPKSFFLISYLLIKSIFYIIRTTKIEKNIEDKIIRRADELADGKKITLEKNFVFLDLSS